MSTANPQSSQYLAPIQLENCFFTEISIKAQPNAKLEDGFGTINVNFGGGPVPESTDRWQLVVRVDLSPVPDKKPTYLGTIECVGIFSVLANIAPEKLEKTVIVNGTGMLYAAIREMLMIVTSRGPFPSICLASQTFSVGFELGKIKEAKEKAS